MLIQFINPKRQIHTIVLHCSASKVTSNYTVEQLTKDHNDRGFAGPGYHFYIRKNGQIVVLRPLTRIGAHVSGYNTGSIGICYEGGVDANGRSADTRTDDQKKAMHELVAALVKYLPTVGSTVKVIQGHRDFPKVAKDCPCFDARPEFAYLLKKAA